MVFNDWVQNLYFMPIKRNLWRMSKRMTLINVNKLLKSIFFANLSKLFINKYVFRQHDMSEKEYINLIPKYTESLYRFLYSNFPEKEVCEKIVEEIFYKLGLNYKDIKSNKSKSWVYSNAYRALIEEVKNVKHFANTPTDFIAADYNKNISSQFHLLDQLKLKHKTVLLLKDIEGFNLQEIADILNTQISAVKLSLFRARVKFQELKGESNGNSDQ
jgi:DNA-directed RNA polymerase specialized sigma24 family protein